MIVYMIFSSIDFTILHFSKNQEKIIFELFKEYNITPAETYTINDKLVKIKGIIEDTDFIVGIEVKRLFLNKYRFHIFVESINFYRYSHMIINTGNDSFDITGIDSFHKTFKSIGVKEYFEMQFRQKIKEAKINSIKSTANSFKV